MNEYSYIYITLDEWEAQCGLTLGLIHPFSRDVRWSSG